MNDPHGWYTVAAILGAVGLWMLLPPGHGRRRWLGALPLVAAGGLILGQSPWLQSWAAELIYGSMAATALVGAVGTITSRQPIYSAAWFALSVAGTAGLVLLNWAEFLAVAILIVYAGAILVMFLFVLMLSQPDGRAAHDRNGWEPLVSAATGAVLVGVLTMNIAGGALRPTGNGIAADAAIGPPTAATKGVDAHSADLSADRSVKDSPADTYGPISPANAEIASADREKQIAKSYSVAGLGAELFSRHLVAVEVAGVLLLAALVAAVVIIGPARRRDPG